MVPETLEAQFDSIEKMMIKRLIGFLTFVTLSLGPEISQNVAFHIFPLGFGHMSQ